MTRRAGAVAILIPFDAGTRVQPRRTPHPYPIRRGLRLVTKAHPPKKEAAQNVSSICPT
jgi:hypothetical protein